MGPRSRRWMILDFTGKWMSQTCGRILFQVDVYYSTCKGGTWQEAVSCVQGVGMKTRGLTGLARPGAYH